MAEVRGTGPVAGVDGYRAGWVVAVLAARTATVSVCATAGEVLAATDACRAVAVDIPMGLPDTGDRECDTLARRELPGAASSVFSAPRRWMLEIYDDDSRISHAALLAHPRRGQDKGISVQGFRLIPKIHEWDEVLTRAMQDRVVEAHPEVTFRALAQELGDSRPMLSKKTAAGAVQRMRLLRTHLDVDAVLDALPPEVSGPALDDVLDALVLTWTARRLAAGRARHLPPQDERRHGLLMQIVV